MDYQIKPITAQGVSGALERAHTYRLLNEPLQAESICLDVLELEPENQQALVTLLLAITDQFEHGLKGRVDDARSILSRLTDEHDRRYYAGVIEERGGKALLRAGQPGETVFDWIKAALQHYNDAASIAPPDKNDAILRWNTCVRILDRHPEVRPREAPGEGDHIAVESFDDEVPYR